MRLLTRRSLSSLLTQAARREPARVPERPAERLPERPNAMPRSAVRAFAISKDGSRAPIARGQMVGAAFTPTQPKAGRRQLVGREREQARIMQALLDDRAHVVLYSERGRGKTTLGNWIIEALRQSGVMVGRFTCDATTTYDELIRGVVNDLPSSLLAVDVARNSSGHGCGGALPPRSLQPSDVILLPDRLACRRVVLVIDEFDRVLHEETRTRLADTIKQLSDRSVPVQFLILGVSDNLEEIIGQHPSIKRAICGVHLRLFDDSELAEMIRRGCKEIGIAIPGAMSDRIVALARGMPHMAQLLGLRITQETVARGGRQVNDDDYREAIGRLIEEASPSTQSLYRKLTRNGSDAPGVRSLRHVARASQDAWGRIEVCEHADGTAVIDGKPMDATNWAPIKATGLLVPAAQSADLWAFADRALFYHALLVAELDNGGADTVAENQAATMQPAGPMGRIPALQFP